jgi:holliday junction DNA helicase RuvA
MISHLRGRVAHRGAGTVVVDVGGVGYLVHVTGATSVPARGESVELHTSLQVREDSMTLYGFTDRGSLELFELLLSSSGVGPRIALAALGTHRPDTLRAAIAGGDVATLTAVPGIGKKVAERLVLELKDKVGLVAEGLPAPTAGDAGAGATGGDARAEVREALLGLGYSAGEAQAALAAVDVEAGGDDASELLRLALRTLATTSLDGGGR